MNHDTYEAAQPSGLSAEETDQTAGKNELQPVCFPPIHPFGRLIQDKWLAEKTLEEAAELAEASKDWLKSLDPRDPAGHLDQCQQLLQLAGVSPDRETEAQWMTHIRAADRQRMLDELADLLQTVANLTVAYHITDEEMESAVRRCEEKNRQRAQQRA